MVILSLTDHESELLQESILSVRQRLQKQLCESKEEEVSTPNLERRVQTLSEILNRLKQSVYIDKIKRGEMNGYGD